MKNILLLITTLVLHYQSFAQGVGINTISPDPSAALDIRSNDKGVLIPKVSLTSLIDKTTISSPANGLLVYNTNANLKFGVGFYFNANTSVSPDWKSTSEWKLPYYGPTSEPNSAFLIENYQGGQNSVAIKGYSGGSGTGVHARSDGGVALKAEGGVKIFGNGQNPGVGKVLTSDVEGNAKWDNGVAFKAAGIKPFGSEKIAKQIATKIPFNTEYYDIGNNHNDINTSPHNIFTAPTKGIYEFHARTAWYLSGDESSVKFTAVISINTIVGAVESTVATYDKTDNGSNTIAVSTIIMLEAGDKVKVNFYQDGFDFLSLRLEDAHSEFDGRLVMKQ